MKKGLLEQKSGLVYWFIKIGRSGNSSMESVIGEM